MKQPYDTLVNVTLFHDQRILLRLFNLSFFSGHSNLTSKSGTEKVISILELYLTPIIIVIGILGNALSLAVFSLTHLKRISSSFFLATLSVADILFLSSLAFVWLEKVDVLLYTRFGWCPSVIYVSRVSGCVAAWSVVSFTAERYITVHYPLLKDVICTRKRASCGAASMVAVSFIFYVYIAWSYQVIPMGGIVKSLCSPVARHQYFMSVMIGADTLLSCLIPTVVIVILNASIIRKIRKYQQQNRGVAVQYCSRRTCHLFATCERNYLKGNVVDSLDSELIIRFGRQAKLRNCNSDNVGFHRAKDDDPTTKDKRLTTILGIYPMINCRNKDNLSFHDNPNEHVRTCNRLHRSTLYYQSNHLRCYHSDRHFSYHGMECDDANNRYTARNLRLVSSAFQRMSPGGRFGEAQPSKFQKSIMSNGCSDIEDDENHV